MSAFSADWLALREPADAAARSRGLTQALAATLTSHTELRALDLGSGTGSNVRFLVDHLAARQRWTLVDHDAILLAAVPKAMTSWGATRGYAVVRDSDDVLLQGSRVDCRLSTRLADLRSVVDDGTLYEGCGLVTASALLDLVSRPWLESLAAHCQQQRARVLLALTYDGRMTCSPSEPEDNAIRELVNRHQRTDKGFGIALGPDAGRVAEACFQRLGYETRSERSDWVLTPEWADLQRELIDGWAQAAAEVDPSRTTLLHGWRARRLSHIDRGHSHIVVGHTDLAAWRK